jgi:hypothetical protein
MDDLHSGSAHHQWSHVDHEPADTRSKQVLLVLFVVITLFLLAYVGWKVVEKEREENMQRKER